MKKAILFSVLTVFSVLLCSACSGNPDTMSPDAGNGSTNTEASEGTKNPDATPLYDTEVQVTDDWKFQYDEEAGGIIIKECLGANKRSDDNLKSKDKDITVPSTFEGFEGLKVIGIGDKAFYNRIMKSLTLPDTIVYIGKEAFSSTDIAQTLIIPDSVLELGEKCFDGYNGEAVVLPPIEAIGSLMFGYSDVKKIVVSEGTKIITNCAFTNCDELSELELPDSVESITGYALPSVCKLETLVLPDNLKEFDVNELPVFEYKHRPKVIFKDITYDFPAVQENDEYILMNDALQAAINNNNVT